MQKEIKAVVKLLSNELHFFSSKFFKFLSSTYKYTVHFYQNLQSKSFISKYFVKLEVAEKKSPKYVFF